MIEKVSKIKKRDYIKWLYPGLGIKRWFLLVALGLCVVVLGLWSMVNNQYTRHAAINLVNWLEIALPNLTFEQGILCLLAGIVLIVLGIQAVLNQYLSCADFHSQEYYQAKELQQGPNIVVLGGGTGLSVLLRGLKEYSSNITAIVSVADDGGSSGRLREQFGVVPVGDIRNCIVALADREDMMERLFSYRFDQGVELDGHSLGNLLLVAMSNLKGSFQDAVADIDHVLHIRGRVLPVADKPLTLKAVLSDGKEIIGESNINEAWLPIERLSICPQATALTDALTAIDEADAIILGPGSLFSSVIPNLLVTGIVEHLTESHAVKFYVCNVMTQRGETDNYTAEDHLHSLFKHSNSEVVDYIVINDQLSLDGSVLARYAEEGAMPVRYDMETLENMGVKVVAKPLLNHDTLLHHDGQKLAGAIMETLYRDSSFRVRRGWLKSFWDRKKLKAR